MPFVVYLRGDCMLNEGLNVEGSGSGLLLGFIILIVIVAAIVFFRKKFR